MIDNSQYEPFKVHLADVSYFSGKLEAYMRYKEIPFERVEMTASGGVEVYAHTGVRKVPALEAANGQWFRETTNIISWLENRYPAHSIMPEDPALLFLSKLVEDYADEWCWRSAMYWRWRSEENANFLGLRIGQEVFNDWPVPAGWAGKFFKARQRHHFLKGDGLSPQTEQLVRDQYLVLSDCFSQILEDQDFLLGNKPTLVDFAFMGPFFRHYFCDPIPAKVMRDAYPGVLAWVSRVWNARASDMPGLQTPGDFSHPGWQPILKELVQDYLPYLHQNLAAFAAGEKRFDNTGSRATFKQVPVVQHRVYCLECLEQHYQSLAEAARIRVDRQLGSFGEISLTGKTLSGLKQSYDLPLQPRPAMSPMERLEVLLLGSPWDMNRPPKSNQ